jgi:D-glycero-alpha-D-manno-heptose-7-phosphate kinase
MIIVQTPLRVSFVGGGTDFKEYYMHHDGAVLSTAINKYVFVIVQRRFDDTICVNYSKRESVNEVNDIEHDLVRETMKLTGVHSGVEITTLADVPSNGTGLGSSSSITVALLQALYAYQGITKNADTIAQEACKIEIETLGRPIGKQDQYIACYGNLRFIEFRSRNTVKIDKLELSTRDINRLFSNLQLFYTGMARDSNSILRHQKDNIGINIELLDELKELAFEAKDALSQREFDEFGKILHKNWEIKKNLANSITNANIDDMYSVALKAGAIGGKICGSGGGGFLLLYSKNGQQDDIRNSLRLKELTFQFEPYGSKIIFDNNRG